MKKLLLTLILVPVLCFAGMFALKIAIPEMFKSIMLHIPVAKNFIQHEFPTYTSITNIKDTMKLVTARQNLDFISIFEGKDGTYIEITTFEVKAGVDFDDEGKFVRLVNSQQIIEEKCHNLRVETGEPDEILQTQSSLPTLDTAHTVILYHLDSLNLSKYSYEDIEAFYSR